MMVRGYAELAFGSLALATGLFAFSSSFGVAVLAFGLLIVGSVALCAAAADAFDD
jgi:hypothetical protein